MSSVASGNTVAEVASLIGDAARANMLSALMGGQALTAGELARHAGVTAQTASGHLGKLAEAHLIAVEKQGRHRYYRLASPDIAHAILALMAVAASGPKRHHPIGPKDEALRLARTYYDHIAGRLAIALADTLSGKGYIVLADGAALITDEGLRFFCDFGIDLEEATRSKVSRELGRAASAAHSIFRQTGANRQCRGNPRYLENGERPLRVDSACSAPQGQRCRSQFRVIVLLLSAEGGPSQSTF